MASEFVMEAIVKIKIPLMPLDLSEYEYGPYGVEVTSVPLHLNNVECRIANGQTFILHHIVGNIKIKGKLLPVMDEENNVIKLFDVEETDNSIIVDKNNEPSANK